MSDQIESTDPVETTEEAAPQEQAAEKTFTQAELDKIVSDRLAREREKFANYEDYKTRAEEAEALKGQTGELTTRAEAAELKALRLEVSMDTGVPMSALTATNEEGLRLQADDLKAWRGETTGVKREADSSGNSTGPASDPKARAREALARLS